jgi:hypothetical protein
LTLNKREKRLTLFEEVITISLAFSESIAKGHLPFYIGAGQALIS